MNTSHYPKLEELTLKDFERITQHARDMRSQVLAEMGAALRTAVARWTRDAWLHARAAISGHTAQRCA